MKSKLCKFLTVILLLTSGYSFAQDNPINNSLNKNKFALVIDGGYNFYGESFEAVIFGLKYHFTDKSALRLDIGMNFSDNGYGRKHHYGDSLHNLNNFMHEYHFGNNSEQYYVSLLYMLYPQPKKIINVFFGIGPRYGFGSSDHERPPDSSAYVNNGNEHNHNHNNNAWSIGLAGAFGAEWFATKNFSIFAEYDAAYSYQSRENGNYNNENDNYQNSNGHENSEYGFTDLSGRIGLSLYFDNPF